MTDEILSLQVTDDSQCRNGFLTARKLIVGSQWQEIVESRKEGKNYPQQTFVLKFYFDKFSRKRSENDLQKFFCKLFKIILRKYFKLSENMIRINSLLVKQYNAKDFQNSQQNYFTKNSFQTFNIFKTNYLQMLFKSLLILPTFFNMFDNKWINTDWLILKSSSPLLPPN